RSNVDMFRELALHMELDQMDPCFRETVDEMIDGAIDPKLNPWLSGITRERLERDGHVRLNFTGNGEQDYNNEPFLPFANGFPTASGKAMLMNPALALDGLDTVA